MIHHLICLQSTFQCLHNPALSFTAQNKAHSSTKAIYHTATVKTTSAQWSSDTSSYLSIKHIPVFTQPSSLLHSSDTEAIYHTATVKTTSAQWSSDTSSYLSIKHIPVFTQPSSLLHSSDTEAIYHTATVKTTSAQWSSDTSSYLSIKHIPQQQNTKTLTFPMTNSNSLYSSKELVNTSEVLQPYSFNKLDSRGTQFYTRSLTKDMKRPSNSLIFVRSFISTTVSTKEFLTTDRWNLSVQNISSSFSNEYLHTGNLQTISITAVKLNASKIESFNHSKPFITKASHLLSSIEKDKRNSNQGEHGASMNKGAITGLSLGIPIALAILLIIIAWAYINKCKKASKILPEEENYINNNYGLKYLADEKESEIANSDAYCKSNDLGSIKGNKEG